MMAKVSGFSKLTKEQKINWLATEVLGEQVEVQSLLKKYWNQDDKLQSLHDDFIENAVSNYYLPFGVAPNFVINGKSFAVPMVIEESSVVAAASLIAKQWSVLGGFKTSVLGTEKIGQVHLKYSGFFSELQDYFDKKNSEILEATDPLTANMRKRGGGIVGMELKDKTAELENYFQVHVKFQTADSMGANFINSCLEAIAGVLRSDRVEVIMSILSNYVPDCKARAELSCAIEDLPVKNPQEFARKFKEAVDIARIEPYRAVTHNKGIMNGVDAVVLATGNDFRAVEAGVHAYAARDGQYRSLSHCSIEDGEFKFWVELPLALGTVGGLTALHPLAQFAMDLLGRPNASELMQITAAVGLAQNFGALRALVTSGIQKGHMKMHLSNILNQEEVFGDLRLKIEDYFKDRTITHKEVLEYIKANK
ncbi:MAG: hydroxymethylglutaryl-CoA reductase, degradative [Flavobacteriaceae bacterium]